MRGDTTESPALAEGGDGVESAGADGQRSGGGGVRTTRIAVAAALAALLAGAALVSSLPSSEPAVRPDAQIAPQGVTRDFAERDDYVVNPGMGWQDMHRDDPAFGQSVEYVRPSGGWAQVNPRSGVYDWSVIDDAIATAQSRGSLLSFRIYSMRHPEWDGHKVPQWVLDDGAELVDDGAPDYSNAVYQEHWGVFVEALRERYDGDPRIAFIDVSGYGNYNEWSWEPQTQWDAGWEPGERPESLDGQARQRLVDVFLGGSGTIEARDADGDVVEVAYDYPGFSETQLVMPYAGVRQSLWYALDARDDVGWRYDCLGQISAADLRGLGEQALSRWRDAPMVYEFCSEVDWSTVDAAVELTHPTLIHDNDTDDLDRVGRTLASIGYRYVLERAEWTRQADVGDRIAVVMRWRNAGRTRAYPPLGADPRIKLRVIDDEGTPVRVTAVDAEAAAWVPGDAQDVEGAIILPGDLPAGEYRVDVAMRDAATGRAIRPAIADLTTDGWLPLGAVVIGDASR